MSQQQVDKNTQDAMYSSFLYRAEEKRIAMGTVIEYLKSQGQLTQGLEDVSDEFKNLYSSGQQPADVEDLVEKSGDKVSEFRQAANSLMTPDQRRQAQQAVAAKTSQKNDYLDRLWNSAEKARRENLETVLDARVCVLRDVVKSVSLLRMDTTGYESKVSAFELGKKTILRVHDLSVEACDRTNLKNCSEEDAVTRIELIDESTMKFKTLRAEMMGAGQERRFTNFIKLIENKLGGVEAIVKDMEKLGIKVEDAQKSAGIRADVEMIKIRVAKKDYEGVELELATQRDRLNELIGGVMG